MLLRYLTEKIDRLTEEFGLNRKAVGLSRIALLLDILACHVRYGCNVADYFMYRFYNLRHRAKKTYMTQWDRMYMMCHVNGMEHFELFEDKRQFVKKYEKFMGRSTCVLSQGEEAYKRWLAENPAEKYIFKPADGSCGEGIFVVARDSEKLLDYAFLMGQNATLVVEPYIENCAELKKLNPGTLNTLRICTLRKAGKPYIFGCYLRMGVAGRDTDNYNNGGVVAEVDPQSGVLVTKATSRKGGQFAFHPDTGEQIVGFQIPMWEEVKALVLEVAEVTPEVIYSSWDIAILPGGPVLIEGNIGGDVDIQQTQGYGVKAIYAPYLPKKQGLHFGFRDVMKPYKTYFQKKAAE